MGLVFGLSLANDSDSESFLTAHSLHHSAKMDASEKDSGRCLLLAFPELFPLAVAY